MFRPITLVSAQWADLPFETLCAKASQYGFDGIELACLGDHFDVRAAANDSSYVEAKKATLNRYGLKTWAIAAHLVGQCIGDPWDPRIDNFVPSNIKGKPDAIVEWAIEEMKQVALAAKAMGCSIVTCFMGSPIWRYWYSFPPTSEEMISQGYAEIVKRWTPIFDVFDEHGIRFALEVHPTEIAFDYYSAVRLLEEFKWRKTLGFNFDPSHLLWQGIKPELFVRDFNDRIFHVHMKDVALNQDGRAGILGSHLPFGDLRRGWNFRSIGHGDVDFEAIMRELNAIGYSGPLSVEWEDSGMDRDYGAQESLQYVRKIDFPRSQIAFDASMKK